VPVVLALLAATAIAWLIEDALPAPEGVPLPAAIALVAWIVAFVLLRRAFTDMRPGE